MADVFPFDFSCLHALVRHLSWATEREATGTSTTTTAQKRLSQRQYGLVDVRQDAPLAVRRDGPDDGLGVRLHLRRQRLPELRHQGRTDARQHDVGDARRERLHEAVGDGAADEVGHVLRRRRRGLRDPLPQRHEVVPQRGDAEGQRPTRGVVPEGVDALADEADLVVQALQLLDPSRKSGQVGRERRDAAGSVAHVGEPLPDLSQSVLHGPECGTELLQPVAHGAVKGRA